MRHGRLYLLVRWMGLDAAGEIQEPLDNLTNNEAAIAAFEEVRAGDRPIAPPSGPAYAASAPHPPAGYTVEAAPPCDLGAALVGRTLIFWFPDEGWLVCLRHSEAPITVEYGQYRIEGQK